MLRDSGTKIQYQSLGQNKPGNFLETMRCNERTNACLRNTKESPRVGNWYFVRRDILCLVLGRLESVHDPRRGGKRRAFVARYIHFNAPRPWTGAAPGPRQVPPIRQMTRDCPPRLCGAQGSVLIRTAAEKELAGPLEGPGCHGSTSPRHDPRLDPFFVTLPLSCLPAQPRFDSVTPSTNGHPRVSLAARCRPETSLPLLQRQPYDSMRQDPQSRPSPAFSSLL